MDSIMSVLNKIYGIFDNLSISVIFSVLFLIVIVCAVLLIDDKKRRKSIMYNPEDWFFHDFNNKMYDILFVRKGETDEQIYNNAFSIAKKMGVDTPNYAKDCYIAGIRNDGIKNIIMMRIYAIIMMIAAFVMYFVFQNIIISIFLLCGTAYLFKSPLRKVHEQAEKKKRQVEDELPRFTELLTIALQLKMPIDQAIKKTAEKIDNSFSKELLELMEKSNITSTGWVSALENMTEKYEIGMLNDFVLNVVSAYTKGVDVYESVVEQLDSMKKQHLSNLTARAKALDTKIMLPIVVGVLIPVVIMILYPTVSQINTML